MAFTYSKIAEVTVGASGVPSIDFINIPQNYTDLLIKVSLRDNYASVSVNFGWKLNGTTTGLSGKNLNANGSTAAAGTNTDGLGFTVGTSGTANTFSSSEIYLPNYSTTDRNKSYSVESAAESNTTTVYSQILAGVWANNAAVNAISIYPTNATLFTQHSSASLYGIKATEY